MFVGRNEEERALANEGGNGGSISRLPQYPDTAERLFMGQLGGQLGGESIFKKIGKGVAKVAKTAVKVATYAGPQAFLFHPKKMFAAAKAVGKFSGNVVARMAKGLAYAATLPIRLAVRKPLKSTLATVMKRKGHTKPTKDDIRETNKIVTDVLIHSTKYSKKLLPVAPLLFFAGHALKFTGTGMSGEEKRKVMEVRRILAKMSGEELKEASQMGIVLTGWEIPAAAAAVMASTLILIKVMGALASKGSGAPAAPAPTDKEEKDSAETEAEAPVEEAPAEEAPEEATDESGQFTKLSVLGY